MTHKQEYRRVVSSWPGEGTGETVYQDDHGNTYRTISRAEAANIEQSTCGRVYHIYPDGDIR
ncbi:MAG: hypothetical protein JNL61_11435 [Rhizobiaceae bacterium]|nr:hypothetical protein [Rhizobiaceae bacterium]